MSLNPISGLGHRPPSSGRKSGSEVSSDQEKDISEKRLDVPSSPRDLIRLLQCTICHKILSQPLALPCGETFCRACMPKTYQRKNISYPNEPGRREGFVCPFPQCGGREHTVADCNLDVTLANVLAVVEAVLLAPPSVNSESELVSCFLLAQKGLLPWDSDSPDPPMSRHSLSNGYDRQLTSTLSEKVRSEFDCQVCYCLYHVPTTTSCGHTFCSACLTRVRDHSNLCPFCRRALSPHRSLTKLNSNKRLDSLLVALCPDAVATREVQTFEDAQLKDQNVPIFACAMTFPQMPMFLHIFEPRYQLMLRRAVDDGTRCFGMVAHRRDASTHPDGDFDAPFTQYGTMLYVTSAQWFPDGRSLIETIGTYRFKILSYRWEDGYPVANIERVDDIPFADEEAMEATERLLSGFPQGSLPEWAQLSTQELHQQGLDFVNSMRNSSAGWFTERMLNSYGQPPQDPAIFPFWLATLLPVHDREKYLVLVSTSVRERLKFVVGWIKAIEQRSWRSQGFMYNFIRHTPTTGVLLVAIFISLSYAEESEEKTSIQAGLSVSFLFTCVGILVASTLLPRILNRA